MPSATNTLPPPTIIALTPSPNILIPRNGNKDTISRLTAYATWLTDQGGGYWDVNLAAYRDHLFDRGLAATTIQAHLSTIRSRYQQLLRDPLVRREMYAYAARRLQAIGAEVNPANSKALVDELRASIQNAIHPSTAPVRVIVDQDPTHYRLTRAQANALLRSIKDLRDKTMVALLLATGIRSEELVKLKIADLRSYMDDGTLALHIRDGKGGKARKVPYGGNEDVLRLVDKWLDDRQTGYVFLGGANGHVSTRTVQRRLKEYPVLMNGEYVILTPHDTRRSYARMQYIAGMDRKGIQANMGHATGNTTDLYIGEVDVAWRMPQAMLDFSD